MTWIEIKHFNAFIDNKQFSNQLVKIKQEAYEKFVKMSRNDDDMKINLLDYLYHQVFHKLIAIVFARWKVQAFINKLVKLEEVNNATIFS